MDPITFKYRPVDEGGREGGWFACHGSLSEEELVLDKVVVPLGCIYQVVSRYNRLTIVYESDIGQTMYTIAPYDGLDRKLKESIDRICSYRWAEDRHKQLEREGNGSAFRTAKCPACTAVVDLTGFADTPQFYCPYCESIQAADQDVEELELRYRLCDRCRLYSLPIRYKTTYVILNVVSWQEHYSCHVCMRRECWKMLAVNLLPPFIGEIFAIINTIRAYGAGIMDSYFPELVGANAYALKGRVEEAKPLYDAMLARVSVQAGLRYNLAMGYAKASEWEDCLETAHVALRDCSNYGPAGGLVGEALMKLQRADEADRFLKSWGMPAASARPALTHEEAERIQRRDTPSPDANIREAREDRV